MAKTTDATALTCMNCGAPIKSGFFCAKCQSGETDEAKGKGKGKEDGWKGSRFSGEAKKKRQQALLMEELQIWGKRILILAVICGVAFGVKTLFGERIVAWYDNVRGVTAPHDKYDPTKDASTDADDQANPNGTRAFTKQAK